MFLFITQIYLVLKMGQLQSQNQEGNANTQEAAWWCKLLARTVGAVGGASKLMKINLEHINQSDHTITCN